MLNKVVFIVFFLATIICFPQQEHRRFERIFSNGSFFTNSVTVVHVDGSGFLWIGTKNGLYRYDGLNLKLYQQNDLKEGTIPDNSINSIAEDDAGNLWIGCESFLVYFQKEKEVFTGYLEGNYVQVVRNKDDNTIWAKDNEKTVVKIDPNSIHNNNNNNNNNNKFSVDIDDFPMDYPIDAFEPDGFGRFWFTNREGIWCLNKNKKQIQASKIKNVSYIKIIEANKLLAVSGNKLYEFYFSKDSERLELLEVYDSFLPVKESQYLYVEQILSVNKGEEMYVVSSKGIFYGIKRNGRYLFDSFIDNDNEDNSKLGVIESICTDLYGNLWIGSRKGVFKLKKLINFFNYYQNEFYNSSVNYFFKDKYQNILLGLESGGLVRFDQTSGNYFQIEDKGGRISAIQYDYFKDEILVGFYNKLYKSNGYDEDLVKNLRFDHIKTYDNFIIAIYPFDSHKTWVGIWGEGIDIINSTEYTELTDFEKEIILKTRGTFISSIFPDQKGYIWIATRGQGLFRVDMDRNEILHYPIVKGGLNSANILCFLEDENNDKLYIGTRTGGLNVYNYLDNSFKTYRAGNGLNDMTVAYLCFDFNKNIWMSTQNGITYFDPRTERFINFGDQDGIESGYFMYGSGNSINDGKNLLFGFDKGIYEVIVDKFQLKLAKPEIVITNFSLLGVSSKNEGLNNENGKMSLNIDIEDEIIIPYDRNNIKIEFASLDLTAPYKNKYAYRLKGANDNWLYTTGGNNSANYNDLEPGNYIFEVKGTNSDGVWNNDLKALSFVILPPFWLSDIAYFIYIVVWILIIVFSLKLLVKWYELKKSLFTESLNRKKEKELSKMKLILFTDISHELKTPLTLIQGTIEGIIKKKDNLITSDSANRIYNNSLRLGRLINQIMDIRKFDIGDYSLKVLKGNVVDDILEIKNAFNDYADLNKITYNLFCEDKKLKGWYDVEIIEKVLYNLLSNAFKFTSQEGEIAIRVKQVHYKKENRVLKNMRVGNYLVCSVRDNGLGIPADEIELIFDRYYQSTKTVSSKIPGTGIGTELVQKLIEKHHGFILVSSDENVFTQFTFYIPLDKSFYNEDEILKGEATVIRKPLTTLPEFQVSEELPYKLPGMDKSSSTNKILIVEDNPELRDMLKRELMTDYLVLEASNGKEGYEIAIAESPNLILSDIFMPVEDGVTFLERMKKNQDVENIPIFMLTARDQQDVRLKCMSLGAEDYIEKPFSVEFVKWKIHNALYARKVLKEKYSKVITAKSSEIDIECPKEVFIKRLIEIIENELDNQALDVNYLADKVGVSRSNLFKKVKESLKKSPAQLIKTIRLERAAQLLKKDTLYISEIAYMTGFNDRKYFSKCFTREYRVSPTEFKNKNTDKV